MERRDIQSPQGLLFFALYPLFFFFFFFLIVFFLSEYIEIAGETARILVEFLEVAISSIVFLKGVYPAGQFSFAPFSDPLSVCLARR